MMLLRYHLNPFAEAWECTKCGNEIEVSIRYCDGTSVNQTENRHGFESLLLPKTAEEEKPYCSLFVIEHLHVTCDKCGFEWHSATADTAADLVKRVNVMVARRRQRVKQAEWPEVIG